MCEKELKNKNFHIDHIKALANGGNNDLENCKFYAKNVILKNMR